MTDQQPLEDIARRSRTEQAIVRTSQGENSFSFTTESPRAISPRLGHGIDFYFVGPEDQLRVVGCAVRYTTGVVWRAFKDHPGLRHEVRDGRMPLAYLVTALAWSMNFDKCPEPHRRGWIADIHALRRLAEEHDIWIPIVGPAE